MVIVIPSYNNKNFYKMNLDSVFAQEYENYRVIYVDDNSPDGTGQLVEDYIKEKGQEKRFQVIRNRERVGSLANLYKAIWLCDKNEIVVDLDGDDALANKKVLSYLNKVYQDPNVWFTYGQFVIYPSNAKGFAFEVPSEVIEKNNFRAFGGGVTHLRTFYAGLFQKIKKEDFLYEGEFLQTAGDIAFMIPICEMCGKHIKFIPDVLYVYNWANPINDDKIKQGLQKKMDLYIRSKQKYQPLTTRP